MKCYYEVLEISREADDAEIKTAYRKQALKWHPDKNIHNTEEAKDQFQLVQQAYEVLSDRQERAWYDNHREQILKGSNTDFKDDSLDVYPFFTTQCFKGYGDDDGGFYAVYRTVFDKITKEDIEHMDSKSDFDEIPTFGNSTSNYDEIVGPFYAYWSSYNTKKSYVWLDPYNINEARNGRILKLIEKENKKTRQKAKKERNEEVRNLVAFVRKRDKRVQIHTKLLEAKVAENRLKHEQLRQQKILENKKELNNSQHAEWSKFDNVKKELKEIEKHLAKQFGENLSDSELSNSEDEENNSDLYCVACNKVFKTPKAFANHESSKKHLANVEVLKQTMLEEENEFDEKNEQENLSIKSEITESDDEFSDLYCVVCKKEFKTAKALSNHETSKKHLENVENLYKDEENNIESVENNSIASDQDNLENIDEELSDLGLNQTPVANGSKKKNKKSKKVIRIQKLSVTEDSTSDGNQISKTKPKEPISDDDFDFVSSKKSKKKNKQKPDLNKSENKENGTQKLTETADITENTEVPEIQNKKRAKKAQKKFTVPVITSADLEDIDLTHCCVICKNNFPSKNKLYEHLKKTGHSVAIPEKTTKSRKKQAK